MQHLFAARPPLLTEGARLLVSYLSRHDLTYAALARAVGVAPTSAYHWAVAMKRPKKDHRIAIERWTRGAVPSTAWALPDERPLAQPLRHRRRARAAA